MRVVKKNRTPDFFDEMFDSVFKSPFYSLSNKIVKMQSNLREKDGKYILDIELAGFNKSDINITIEDQYLNVTATVNEELNSDDVEYIRKERNFTTCSRSYYVGNLSQQDINATFVNGILTITFPVEKIETSDKTIVPID